MDTAALMDNLLVETMNKKATDLHICAGSKPLMRVNSKLTPVDNSERMMPDVINEIVDLYLNEEQKAKLIKNKSVDMSYSKPRLGRFRCNFYTQRGTFAIAIRTLPIETPKFDTLGLPDVVKKFTQKTKGLVLLTGATGSGKSTTLASLIDIINNEYQYHITTIEDPLEYLHRHSKSMVTQREIGGDAISFADALRFSLREDPDVIMVGEMRDMETISIALTAAETGHLVFSTLHTIGAVKAVDRIIDAFPTEQQNQVRSQLATVLEGIVSQQLIPTVGHNGMAVASEVMLATPAVRNLIREGKHYQINNLIQVGAAQGMCSLERNLANMVKDGVITQEEAAYKAQDVQLFNNYLASLS